MDMVNEFKFDDAEQMFLSVLSVAERLTKLKRRIHAAGLP